MDDVLYHIFNNKKLNLDHFTLPGEYYGIASRYLESLTVCLEIFKPSSKDGLFFPTYSCDTRGVALLRSTV